MSVIERRAQAIVQECRREGCEFCGGIARVECIERGHSVGIAYVRAADYEGAAEEIVRLRAALGRIAAGEARPSKLAGEALCPITQDHTRG